MKKFLLLSLLALATAAPAQSTINWFTFDAGGGAQASANYTLNFTAGQNDVGAATQTSASYRIVPGFWSLEDLGPAAARPELTITLSGANVILTWPSASSGFELQQTDSLDVLPASWSNTPGAVSDNGIVKSITLPRDVAKRFYRLRKN